MSLRLCAMSLPFAAMFLAPVVGLSAADDEAEKTALAVEALSRLQGADLNANPTLKETVLKVLEKTRGTADFVKLVQQFKLSGQEQGLLVVAIAQPAGESGVAAMRLILAEGDAALIDQALTSTNTIAATRVAEALGNTGDRRAVKRLAPLAADGKRDVAVRRQAVKSLARTHEGANELLELARADRLGDDVRFAAGAELNRARWPDIQAEAAKTLPPPQGQDARPLPPMDELVRRKGDTVNGARVFARASPGCINCHVVRGQGIELGPDLSEVGSKLGKDALYESILDPSAGVSFGFEAFNLTLKNGDEAYGLIASETADEIALKNVGGIVTRHKKSDVVERQQSKLSIMPEGLQQGMTTGEFVDLVEYLSSLKKAP